MVSLSNGGPFVLTEHAHIKYKNVNGNESVTWNTMCFSAKVHYSDLCSLSLLCSEESIT